MVEIGQFGGVGSCCALFLCAFTLQKVPVLTHLSVLGNSSSKWVVLLLSHHGSEARKSAGMLSEGLELTHLQMCSQDVLIVHRISSKVLPL